MAYPRFRQARAHKIIRRATGTAMTLGATAITELAATTNGPGSGGFDIPLRALVGDVLEWGFNGITGGESNVLTFDIYTMVSGSRTNPFGAGLSAGVATTGGVPGWDIQNAGFAQPLNGSILYTVVSGDIVSGVVTCRPYFACTSATARTLYSTSSYPLSMWLKNLGPVAS